MIRSARGKLPEIAHSARGADSAVVTGDVTLTINGATVTISAAGDVSITSPTKVSMEAPEVNIKGASGEVEIGSIKLTKHKHTGNLGADTSAPKP